MSAKNLQQGEKGGGGGSSPVWSSAAHGPGFKPGFFPNKCYMSAAFLLNEAIIIIFS